MNKKYYIMYERGTCYYVSDEKPEWNAGFNTWSANSKAWMEVELFEQLYPAIAKQLAKAKTHKEGIVEVRIEKGMFRLA